MEYTTGLENMLWDWDSEDDDVSEEVIIDRINHQDTFRSFGDALRDFICPLMSAGYFDEKEYLKDCAASAGITFNRNTLNNWFSGKRPKKSEQSREHMYLLAFSLCLDKEKTTELFRKVYYDRPFDLRNVQEFIYFYCISNQLPYSKALELIGRVKFDETESDKTILTSVIRSHNEKITDEDLLLEWIRVHPHNFRLNSESANKVLNQLLQDVRGREGEKELLTEGRLETTNCSCLAKDLSRQQQDEVTAKLHGKTFTSVSTMLEVIVDQSLVKGKSPDGKGFFKNMEFPKEILSRFPTKLVFSKENPSYEELRKMIILLYSYKYWVESPDEDGEIDFDDYRARMDEILEESSLQPLYPGNPYDWLFLYCSTNFNPLEKFRLIMGEVIISAE